jgi:hypothetical protein
LVENEPPVAEIGLRQRAEAGAYLVELLADEGLDARVALLAACGLPIEEWPGAGVGEFSTHRPANTGCFAAAEQLEAALLPWLEGANAKAQTRPHAGSRFRGNVAPLPAKEPTILDPGATRIPFQRARR